MRMVVHVYVCVSICLYMFENVRVCLNMFVVAYVFVWLRVFVCFACIGVCLCMSCVVAYGCVCLTLFVHD